MTIAAERRIRRSAAYNPAGFGSGMHVRAEHTRERITCSDALNRRLQNPKAWKDASSVHGDIRILKVDKVGNKQKLLTRGGIRWDLASAILLAMAVVFAIVLLTDLGVNGTSVRQIRTMELKLQAMQEKNDKLERQVAASMEDTNVKMEAVKLNLISSGGAGTVWLTVPEEATMLPADQPPRQEQSGVSSSNIVNLTKGD